MYPLTLHWAPRARGDAVCYPPVCSSTPGLSSPSLSTDASVFYFTEETETARLPIRSFLPIVSICSCLNPPPCQCFSSRLSSGSHPFSPPQKTRLQSPLPSADIHSVPVHKPCPPSLPSVAKLPQSTVTPSPSLVPHSEFCPRTVEPTATVLS